MLICEPKNQLALSDIMRNIGKPIIYRIDNQEPTVFLPIATEVKNGEHMIVGFLFSSDLNVPIQGDRKLGVTTLAYNPNHFYKYEEVE